MARHHTRFYPADEQGTDLKNNGNPKSGTVVDKGVTGVYTFDFFLQSVRIYIISSIGVCADRTRLTAWCVVIQDAIGMLTHLWSFYMEQSA